MKRLNTGFTLIELLTVIAIIGILASILIPVVGAVRESARAAQCVSNLRQMGQGIHMYAQENNGKAPPANDIFAHQRQTGHESGSSAYSTFHGSIWPYVFGDDELTLDKIRNETDDPNIFQCPTVFGSYPSADQAPAHLFYRNQTNSASYGVYSYAKASQAVPDGDVTQSVNLDSLTTASLTVAVIESFHWNAGANGQFYDALGLVPHNESGNFLFYDGHVERYHRNEIPVISDRASVFWYGDNAN